MLRVSLDDGIHFALLDAIWIVYLCKKRLAAARFVRGFPANRFPLAILFERLVGSRRAFLAIVTGTCSKRVVLTVMVASLVAACTVAALSGYGEYL